MLSVCKDKNILVQFCIYIALSVGLISIIILCYEIFYDINYLSLEDNGLIYAHYIALTIITFALTIVTFGVFTVARIQLKEMNNIQENDFLLRFDKRYCNRESLEAKTILHEMYINSKSNKYPPGGKEHLAEIAKRIQEMSKSNDIKVLTNFMKLINFLDTLETIAYFVNKDERFKKNKVKDIEEFLGNSVIYFYLVFEKWINENCREKHGDYSYYYELEELVRNLSEICNICNKRNELQEIASYILIDKQNNQTCKECKIII